MWEILLVVYLISPIPLLVICLSLRSDNKILKNRIRDLEKEKQKPVSKPNQQIQPDTQADVPVVSALNEEKAVLTPAPAKESPVSPADRESPSSKMQDAFTDLPPVFIRIPEETRQRLAESHAGDPAPHITGFQPAKADSDSRELSSIAPILIIGVVLLMLASVGFISAAWSNLSIGTRAACLLSFSFILLAAGIFAKAKLNLENTSIAFYAIGSVALPVTIIGSASFGLLGTGFTMSGPYLYNTILLALFCFLIPLVFGTGFFQSNLFAVATLSDISLLVFTLAIRTEHDPYRLSVLLIAVYAAAVVLLVPYVKDLPTDSPFRPYAEVIELFSVANLLCMSIVALSLSGKSPYAGLFLLILAAAFLHPVITSRADQLLSLPSVILFLVGTGLLFTPDNWLSAVIWTETVAVSAVAFSYLLKKHGFLRNAFLLTGILFLTGASVPLFYYCLIANTANPAPLLLALPLIGGFVFLTIDKKKPLYAAGALLPLYTLLTGLSLHIVSRFVPKAIETLSEAVFPELPRGPVMLTALVVAAVLYLLWHFIPHQPFFTGFGAVLLLFILSFSAFLYTETFTEQSDRFMSKLIFAFAFLLLSIFMAYRTDRLNVRDRNRTEIPVSLVILRSLYACIGPFYFITASVSWDARNLPSETGYALVSLILVSFGFLLFLLSRSDEQSLNVFETRDDISGLPRLLLGITYILTLLAALFVLCLDGMYNVDNLTALTTLRHLLPFTIPMLLLYVYLHFKKLPEQARLSLLLGALYTATAFLFYAAELFFTFGIPEKTGMPELCFRAEFLLSLLLVPVALYYLLRTEAGKLPLRAGFIWLITVTVFLFFFRLFRADLTSDVIYSVSVGLSLLFLACLFRRAYLSVSLLFIGAFAVHYLSLIHSLSTGYSVPAWGEVLLMQIPVLLFVLTEYRAFLLVFQPIVTVTVPFFTDKANSLVFNCLTESGVAPKHANVIAKVFRTLVYLYDSHFVVLTLLGWAVIALYFYFTADSETVRRRVLALSAFGLSLLLCFRFPFAMSVSDYINHFYLIPPTVFIAFLTWIIPESETPVNDSRLTSHSARFLYAIAVMFLLGIAALGDESIGNLLWYAIISVLLLLLGYVTEERDYLKLGIVCMAALIVYLINRIWGDMAWWIYLFISGVTLVTIAVRNEIRKRR